jgi:hypothetical protein
MPKGKAKKGKGGSQPEEEEEKKGPSKLKACK